MNLKKIFDSDFSQMEADSIEEYFGTLQDAVIEGWRCHLTTDSYSEHMALDEFYSKMPDLLDTLIEDYMGLYGKLTSFSSLFGASGPEMSAIDFMSRLRSFVIKGENQFIQDDELRSDVDAILSLIDTTKYKLINLK